MFPHSSSNNLPRTTEESKTQCGDSFCIDIISIRANLTNFVIGSFLFFKNVKHKAEMTHFPIVSQGSSPQAPWDPSPEQDLLAVPTVLPTALYDQMAPQLCQFEISHLTFVRCIFFSDRVCRRNHHQKFGKDHFACISIYRGPFPPFWW